jgi:glycosyltransferase 2 family protein
VLGITGSVAAMADAEPTGRSPFYSTTGSRGSAGDIVLKLSLKLAFTAVIITAIVWQLGDPRELGRLLVDIDPVYVLLLLAVTTLDRALMTYKWRLLLRSRDQHLRFFHGLRIYCAAMMWGMFLPATVGADAIRAISTSRSGLDTDEVVASIVIERMVGFIASLVLGLLSLLLLFLLDSLHARFKPLWWFGGLALLMATFAFATSFSQTSFDFIYDRLLQRFASTRIMQRLRQAHLTYLAYRDKKRSLAIFLGLTVTQQLWSTLNLWLVACALGIEVSLLYIFGAVPLVFLLSRLPISIAGLGVFEGGFILLMSLAGLTTAESLGIVLVGRIVEIASWLPWWLAHVIGYGELRTTTAHGREGHSIP